MYAFPQMWTLRATRPVVRDDSGRITHTPEDRFISVEDTDPRVAARRAVQYFPDAPDWTVRVKNRRGDFVAPSSATLLPRDEEGAEDVA